MKLKALTPILFFIAGSMSAVVKFGVDLEVLRTDLVKVNNGANGQQVNQFIADLAQKSHQDFEQEILGGLSQAKEQLKKSTNTQGSTRLFTALARAAKKLELISDERFGIDLKKLKRDLLVIYCADTSLIIGIEQLSNNKAISEQDLKNKLAAWHKRIQQDVAQNQNNKSLKSVSALLQAAHDDHELKETLDEIKPDIDAAVNEDIDVDVDEVDVADVLKSLEPKPALLSTMQKWVLLAGSGLLIAGGIYKAVQYFGSVSLNKNIKILDQLMNAANTGNGQEVYDHYQKFARALTLVTKQEKELLRAALNSGNFQKFWDCAQTICERLEALNEKSGIVQKVKLGLLHDYRTVKGCFF